ncbi:hypothetical protein FNV43_RR10874 [Rhamnella rubrinervis]|uniref:Uncharacterized protein n=1 Tax=Rhamnella rubrinervis TaxID=2594499 RepID=A0A8K0H4X3_9ROSA|nr:hypothetical protein FNV43_RR10874 [Rhamnella rubrinervis]
MWTIVGLRCYTIFTPKRHGLWVYENRGFSTYSSLAVSTLAPWLRLDLVTSLNTSSTKLAKSSGSAEGDTKRVSSTGTVTNGIKHASLGRNTITTDWNYGHFTRVLVDVDLAGFVIEKLLLKMTDDCIEVDLYFELFLNFYTSSHSIGHSVAKYMLMIGKTPHKVGSHGNEKENKTLNLTYMYELKQTPSLHVPTTNAFKVLNTNVTPTHIEDIIHQNEAIPSSMVDINKEMGIKIQPTILNLGVVPSRVDFNTEVGKRFWTTSDTVWSPAYHGTVPCPIISWADAFGNSDEEHGDDVDDIIEGDWPSL